MGPIADATTSVPPLSNKVFSLALALPILGQSPSRSRTRPKTGLFSSAAGWNHWTWVLVGEHVQTPLILCRGAQTQSLPNPKLASTSGQRALCPPTPHGREAVRTGCSVGDGSWNVPLTFSRPWFASVCNHCMCLDKMTSKGRSSPPCLHLPWNIREAQKNSYPSLASSAFK